MAAGAVSLRKSHDIVILSFCNIAKGQANYLDPCSAPFSCVLFAPFFHGEIILFIYLLNIGLKGRQSLLAT